MIVAELCADSALEGRWSEAYHYATQGLNAREALFHLYTGLTLWCESEALVRAGDVEQASQDMRHVKERLGNSRRYQLPYLRAKAVLTVHHRKFNQAPGYLSEAAQLAEGIGLPGEAWSIQATIGEMHQHKGDQEMASRRSLASARASSRLRTSWKKSSAAFLAAAPARRVLERGHLAN